MTGLVRLLFDWMFGSPNSGPSPAAKQATALNNAGVAAFQAGDYVRAATLFEQANELMPNVPYIEKNLSNAKAREQLRKLDLLSALAEPDATGSDSQNKPGFTGKRFYEMFAKSWINRAAITEPAWAARKIRLDDNSEPTGPMPSDVFDYKIYQSFGAEVDFENGKIVHADYTPGSVALANTTFGVPGDVSVGKETKMISSNGTGVIFTRCIQGHPNDLIKAVDLAMEAAMKASLGLNFPATNIKIFSVLQLTVTANGVTARGWGSGFPTHYFWIRDATGTHRLPAQPQVQPSQYFEAGPKGCEGI